MTFTYDSAAAAGTATALHNVRLAIGDTDSTAVLFTDEELGIYLDARSDSVNLAAADACETLARRFARQYDFSTDGQSFSRSQMSKMYLDLAVQLRSRGEGLTTQPVTKVDGYSDDIAADAVAAQSDANPRQTFVVIGGPDVLP